MYNELSWGLKFLLYLSFDGYVNLVIVLNAEDVYIIRPNPCFTFSTYVGGRLDMSMNVRTLQFGLKTCNFRNMHDFLKY